MSDATEKTFSMNALLLNSALYRQFQAEREEILKHKWYESEKAGYDIGFELARTDWIIRHRARWVRRWQMETRGRADLTAQVETANFAS